MKRKRLIPWVCPLLLLCLLGCRETPAPTSSASLTPTAHSSTTTVKTTVSHTSTTTDTGRSTAGTTANTTVQTGVTAKSTTRSTTTGTSGTVTQTTASTTEQPGPQYSSDTQRIQGEWIRLDSATDYSAYADRWNDEVEEQLLHRFSWWNEDGRAPIWDLTDLSVTTACFFHGDGTLTVSSVAIQKGNLTTAEALYQQLRYRIDRTVTGHAQNTGITTDVLLQEVGYTSTDQLAEELWTSCSFRQVLAAQPPATYQYALRNGTVAVTDATTKESREFSYTFEGDDRLRLANGNRSLYFRRQES